MLLNIGDDRHFSTIECAVANAINTAICNDFNGYKVSSRVTNDNPNFFNFDNTSTLYPLTPRTAQQAYLV